MSDILFGNNNTKTIKRLSRQYFRKNKVRNLAAILAIVLTAFLFTSVTSLAFNMISSMQLSMQMQKGSKGDGTFDTSMPNAETNVGLELTTWRSRLEVRSRVKCSTH